MKKEYEKFSLNNFKGLINTNYSIDILSEILLNLDNIANKNNIIFFKKSAYRNVFKKDTFIIKEYINVKITDWIKNFFKKSKAKKEWEVLIKLNEKKINAPIPILFAETRKFGILFKAVLIVENIENTQDLLLIRNEINKESINTKIELIKKLACFILDIHKKGLHHNDLHGSNILLDLKNKKFYLLDFHRLCWKKELKEKHILNDLAYLNTSISSYFNKQDSIRFLYEYFNNSKIPIRNIREKIFKINYLSSKYCDLILPIRKLKKIKEQIAGIEEKKIIKESKKTIVSYFKCNPLFLALVKQDKTGKVRKIYELKQEWINSLKLKNYGIMTPLPILINFDKEKKIAYRFIENSCNIDTFFYENKLSFKEKIKFIKTLALFIRKIHCQKIYHRDLKCANIIIRKINEKYQLFLIDNARVKFKEILKEKEIIFNLSQINASFKQGICDKDRKRFIMYYSKKDKKIRNLIYKNKEKINKITKSRWK